MLEALDQRESLSRGSGKYVLIQEDSTNKRQTESPEGQYDLFMILNNIFFRLKTSK